MKSVGREIGRIWKDLREEKDNNQGPLHEKV